MTFEEALRTELINITTLNNKVYPLNAPEGTVAPYIVYKSSEGLNDKSLNGFLESKEVSCELDVIHNSYANMKTLAKLIMDKLKSFEERTIGTAGPHIEELTFDDDCPELYESEINQYRKTINFKVSFKEV